MTHIHVLYLLYPSVMTSLACRYTVEDEVDSTSGAEYCRLVARTYCVCCVTQAEPKAVISWCLRVMMWHVQAAPRGVFVPYYNSSINLRRVMF